MLQKHIGTIGNATVQDNKTMLKSFLSLVTFYIQFMPNVAEMLKHIKN